MLLYIPFEQGISKLFSYFFFTFFFFCFPPSFTWPHHLYPWQHLHMYSYLSRTLSDAGRSEIQERRAEQASKFHQTPILYDHPSSLEKCIPASSGIKSSILWAHWISMKSEGHHHFVELLTQRHPCRLSLEPHHVHLLKYTSHQFFQIRAFSNS